jgi:exopolysaccharide biosynthesis protein
MKIINFILFLFFAPLLIILLFLYQFDNNTSYFFNEIDKFVVKNSFESINSIDTVFFDTKEINHNSQMIISNLKNDLSIYYELNEYVTNMTENINMKSRYCKILYDFLIEKKLGDSTYTLTNDDYKLMIYKIENDKFKGFMAKIKLYNQNVFKLQIANDTLGEKLPTSIIAKNNNAILAINGGGFYKTYVDDEPFTQMIGTTLSSGNIIASNPMTESGFFIAGTDIYGHLTGKTLNSSTNINELNIANGVSFIPILLKNKQKQLIPLYWQNMKHPRTVISKFANEDLLLLVIDGRQKNYSEGITLEKLQDVLLEFGVIDAYNLDGGGSSTFFYNGEILNRPSDGNERYVPNSFILINNFDN